ncbi:MAG: hypothetical protein CMF59_13990 [Leptospiraceae bacterium]|nr:hypothetical protein [Leptospiraceae bacterium]
MEQSRPEPHKIGPDCGNRVQSKRGRSKLHENSALLDEDAAATPVNQESILEDVPAPNPRQSQLDAGTVQFWTE